MDDSLFFWGVAKRYKYGKGVAATAWDQISAKKQQKIDRQLTALAEKIVRRQGKVKPGLKTRAVFFAMHLMQRNGFNERDVKYWKEKGWTGNVRPWK